MALSTLADQLKHQQRALTRLGSQMLLLDSTYLRGIIMTFGCGSLGAAKLKCFLQNGSSWCRINGKWMGHLYISTPS
jgi:hypothetical protein